ncbi:MAG: RNA 2',3'-cyclic phosphodiesterase, partial [Candidatus Omnitrophica bacterium]|nr:RNA 2',3'-cyclic phosphodiesterase [Candidatus Omnitrophota bacterium]
IPLHDIFHQEIESLLRPLRREVSSVRWTDSRQVHLTLHFFGSVPAKEIEPIDLSSRKIATLFSPLKLSLNGIGGFPSLERPNIIWLGVEEPSGRLLSLQKAIQGEMRTLGFETETRPFQPHATIGRVKWKNKDFKPFLTKIPSEWPTPEKIADHFVLYQSHLLPEGVRYEVLKTYPLSKKA